MAQHATHAKLRNKLVATGVVLATGAALLSGGIYAGWTSEATVDQGVGAVDLTAGFIETGGADNLFDEIEDAFPGDYWTRYATLANDGSIDQQFTVRVDTLTDALTAPADGLKAAITTCAVAFVNGACEENDVMPNPDTEVGGTVPNPDDDAVQILADGFITDAGYSAANVLVGEDDVLYFKIRYEFPADADQATFEGQVDTAVVEVESVTAQRAGEDRS